MTGNHRALLLVVVLGGTGSTAPALPLGPAPQQSVPADGGPCLGCGSPVNEGGLALRQRGRIVRICPESHCRESWSATPELLFAQLQPRSALFDEPADAGQRLSWGWFAAGSYAVFALLCAAATAYVAVTRGHAPLPWFFAGLAGTLVALALVCCRPRRGGSDLPQGIPRGLRKVPTTRGPSRCPACGASNHPAASRCSSCSAPLEPSVASEVLRALRG